MKALLLAVALVHGTVFTGDGPPLEDATVLIRGERVVAVGQNVRVPESAEVVDVAGGWITPGLIDSASRLGVVDVNLEATSVEGTLGTKDDPVRAAVRTADTFNGESFAIPVARGGGLTSAIVMPSGGVISGQAAAVDLIETGGVLDPAVALRAGVRGGQPGGARTRALLDIREALTDAQLARSSASAYTRRNLRELSISPADVEVLKRAVARALPVVFEVDRATDIRAVLALAAEFRLRPILLGATEGWKVASELADARVPVLVDPLHNLPSTFDMLQVRDDNAYRMHQQGVKVAFTMRGEVHLQHRLRWLAGNAVHQGFSREEALAAITRIPAEIFRLQRRGVLERGAVANIVVWNGDPLEVTTWPTHIYLRGEEVPLRSRQDALTERYR